MYAWYTSTYIVFDIIVLHRDGIRFNMVAQIMSHRSLHIINYSCIHIYYHAVRLCIVDYENDRTKYMMLTSNRCVIFPGGGPPSVRLCRM
jgi:hypothetical protein